MSEGHSYRPGDRVGFTFGPGDETDWRGTVTTLDPLRVRWDGDEVDAVIVEPETIFAVGVE